MIILVLFAGSIILGCNSSTTKGNKEKFLILLNNYNQAFSDWDSTYDCDLPNLKSKESRLEKTDDKLQTFVNELIRNNEVVEIEKPIQPNQNSRYKIKFLYDSTIWILETEGTWQINQPMPGLKAHHKCP